MLINIFGKIPNSVNITIGENNGWHIIKGVKWNKNMVEIQFVLTIKFYEYLNQTIKFYFCIPQNIYDVK